MDSDLVLIGGGKMGSALLAGWLARGLKPERVRVVEPNAATAEALRQKHGVRVVAEPAAIEPGFRPQVVLIAVKPQMMAGALPHYARFVAPATLFLSIAAGKTIATLAGMLGGQPAIVRAMPNT